MTDDMDFDLELPDVGELTFPQWRNWLAEYNKFIGERDVRYAAGLRERDERIEKLEAALTPFLKLPIGVINDDPPEMEVYQCHGWPRDQLAVVTVADFRRVRKALEGKDD